MDRGRTQRANRACRRAPAPASPALDRSSVRAGGGGAGVGDCGVSRDQARGRLENSGPPDHPASAGAGNHQLSRHHARRRTIAYATQQGTSETQLYLRDLNAFEARPVPSSNGARQPFFSPDGKWVAFFARGFMQKAEVAGGAPMRVVEAPYSYGGTWNEDNTIIYAASLGSGLLRVPAGGGTPESLTKPDGAANVFPQALPRGRDVLFAVWGQKQGTAVLSLASRKWELVLPNTAFAWGVFDPAGGSGGRLLLVNESGGMRAAPFDAAHPAPTSTDNTVLSNVYFDM